MEKKDNACNWGSIENMSWMAEEQSQTDVADPQVM